MVFTVLHGEQSAIEIPKGYIGLLVLYYIVVEVARRTLKWNKILTQTMKSHFVDYTQESQLYVPKSAAFIASPSCYASAQHASTRVN